MKIKYAKGTCQNCGKSVNIAIDENANVVYTAPNLASFNFYKNVMLATCPHCGYIAQDITKDKALNFTELKNSEKYKYLYNYEYIPNYEDVDTYEVQSYDASTYECYSYFLANNHNFEGSIRFLYRAVELKLAIIKVMNIVKFEDYDDDEIEERQEIDKFIENLQKSIQKNYHAICEMFKQKFNVYSKVMYIIALKNIGEDQKAQQQLELLEKENIEQDLLDYTKSKINEN